MWGLLTLLQLYRIKRGSAPFLFIAENHVVASRAELAQQRAPCTARHGSHKHLVYHHPHQPGVKWAQAPFELLVEDGFVPPWNHFHDVEPLRWRSFVRVFEHIHRLVHVVLRRRLRCVSGPDVALKMALIYDPKALNKNLYL